MYISLICTFVFVYFSSSFQIHIHKRFHNIFVRGGNIDSDKLQEKYEELGIHHREYPGDNFSHILGINDVNHKASKLQSICRLQITNTILNKIPIDTQGCGIDRTFYISADQYDEEIRDFDEEYGKPLNLSTRIIHSYSPASMAIAAEFKKASPSKGDINVDLDPVKQCTEYAKVGAAVISVLTEFTHFKGTLHDMKRVRLATQKWALENNKLRPAILRKDFILDRLQESF